MPTRSMQVADAPATERHVLSETPTTQDYPAILARNGWIGMAKARGKLPDLISRHVVMPIGLGDLSGKIAGLE